MAAFEGISSWGPYSAGRAAVLGAYESCISGNDAGLFVVVFGPDCGDASREALCKSASALGYGPDGVTFVDLSARSLSAAELYEVLEGLDPIVVVCAGAEAVRQFSEAYRCQVAPHAAQRVQGREVRAFPQIDGQMESNEGKQAVWRALKSLPHLVAK